MNYRHCQKLCFNAEQPEVTEENQKTLFLYV